MFGVFYFRSSRPMRLVSPKLVATLALAVASILLVACSSDDPGLLPGDDAQQILSNLDRVEELAANGECALALESIETISQQVDSLPNSVSGRLRQNLRRGVGRLGEVTATSCGEPTTAETDTTEETTTIPEDETVIEPEGETNTTDQPRTGPTGPTGGPGNRSGRGGGAGRGNGNNGQGPPPTRGGNNGNGRGNNGNNGSGQQPEPTTELPPDDADSGGISPEEPADTEATP